MPSPYQQGIDIAPPGDDDPDYREVDVVGFREMITNLYLWLDSD